MDEKKSFLLVAAFVAIFITAHAMSQKGSAQAPATTPPATTPPAEQETGVLTAAAPTPRDPGQAPYQRIEITSPSPQSAPQITSVTTEAASTPPAAASAPPFTLNASPVKFSGAKPMLVNGQWMVPVQAIAQQMGGNVDWNQDDNSLDVNLPDQQEFSLTQEDVDPTIWDVPAALWDADQRAQYAALMDSMDPNRVVLIDNHAYMPLDQLVSAFGGSEDVDPSTGMVTINLPQSGG